MSKICVCENLYCVIVEDPEYDLTDEDCMGCPYNKVLTDDEAEKFIEWANRKYGGLK